MKASELRAKDVAGLEKEVSDLLKAHFGLRMQKATQQLTNHSHARQHAARHRPRQDHPGREEERRRNERAGQEDRSEAMNADVTASTDGRAPQPRAKNTRTLVGKVVSDKRSKTDHRADRAPHQARAVRQDRRQVEQVPRA